MSNKRRILLTTGSQRDLHEFVTLVESKTNSQIISQTAESFEKLTARLLEAECDLILVNENRKLDASAINTLLLSTSIPVILLSNNPTVDHAVDMMSAGVSGVADWQDLDRVVELINRNLTRQPIGTTETICKNIVDHQTELICRYDSDLRLLFANRAYYEWQGLPAEELIGKSFKENILDTDRGNAIAHVKALSKENPVAVSVHSAVLPDGTIQTIEWTDRVIFDDNGEIQEYQGVGRDVTEREKAYHIIRKSEERLRLSTELAGVAVWEYDFVADRMSRSDNHDQLYGLPPQDEWTIDTFLNSIHPDDREYSNQIIQASIEPGGPNTYRFDFRVLRSDESVRWLEVSCEVIERNKQGIPELIHGCLIDITERKQATEALRESEEKYRTFIEGSETVIVVVDESGELYFANEATGKLMNMDVDEIVGKNMYELFPPEVADYQLKLVGEVIDTGQGTFYESAMPMFDGQHWFRNSLQPLINISGVVDKVIVNSIDITRIKKIESALRQSEEQFRNIYEQSPIAIQIYDSKGNLTNVNQRTLELYGIDDKKYMPDYNFWANPSLNKEHKVALRNGQAVKVSDSLDFENVRATNLFPTNKSGIMHFDIYVYPLVLEGKTVGYLSQMVDITERNQAQVALEEANKQLEQRVHERTIELEQSKDSIEAIFNHSADGILLLDTKLKIQQGNEAFEQMFGLHANTYFNESLCDFISDKDRKNAESQLEDIVERHETKRLEVQAKRHNGIIFDVEMSVAPVNPDSTVENLVCIVRDITERKEYEQQLKYHASLQENVNDAVIVMDMDFTIQSWNKAAENIYGWTEEEAIGKSAIEFSGVKMSPEEIADVVNLLYEQGWWQGGVTHYHKSDTELEVWTSLTLIKDDSGNPYGVITINSDISKRKEYERQLQYHASLQENVSDAVIVTDMDYVIQSWNRAAERIYGWTADDVIGKSSTEVLRTVMTPNERERSSRQLQEQGWWQGEVIQYHRDDRVLNILGSITLIKDENGNPLSVIAVNHNITERKQAEIALRESEKRYERIVNLSEEAILLTDKEAHITYVNPTWVRLTGYSEEETLGRKYFSFLTLENQEAARKRFQDKKAGKTFRLDTQIVRKAGNIMWVLTTASPVMSPSGDFQGILVMLTDVDLRKQVEIELAISLEYEREMQQYLTILHEISLKLAQTETLDDFYRVTVTEGLARLGFERMGFLLYDESDGSAVGTYGTDADGNVVAEHHLRLRPDSLTGILQDTMTNSDRFVFIKETQLFSNREQIGIGDNAVAALWHDRILGWLAIDNGVNYEPINQRTSDVLTLYALTVGSQLASKQAQQALQRSEEKYRIIANNINDLIIRVNLQSDIVYASPSSYKLLGYYPDEMIELNELDLVHPDDVERVRKMMNQALELGPVGLILEERLQHKNGAYLWVEVTAQAVYEHTDQKPLELILSIRDISERKAAELEIKAVTERLQLATSVGQIGVWYYDAVAKQLVWDEQMFSIYGVDSSKVTPSIEFWKTRVHPDDYDEAVANVGKPLRGDEVFQGEYRILTPGGSTRHLRVRAMRELDEKGQHLRTIGVNIDITDMKEAEIALRESELRFRQLINAAPIATVVTDHNGLITLINEQAEELFGYERSELIGQPVEILIPDASQIQHVHHRSSYMQAPHLREMGAGLDLFAKRKDGSLFATEIQLSYVDTPDGILVMSYVMDITERKRVEAELERQRIFLRAVIDASPSMIFVKDIDGHFVFVNPAMATFFDTSVEALVVKSDKDLNIPLDQIDDFNDADRRVITQGETISLEEGLTLGTGETRWLQTTKVPLVSEDGQSIHVLGISTDITERKQAEITLQNALAKEKELNKLKSSFVSTASHQFRTPLAAILSNTETLSAYRDRLDDSQIEIRLDRIRNQVNRMKGLMDDVLELSRIQANQIRYKPEQGDLDALCSEVIEDFSYQKAYADRIVYQVSQTPFICIFDPHLMHHVISNLIHNALKYSSEEEIVNVSLAIVDQEVEFRVIDRGIGIPEDYLSKLFVPFSRAENVGSIAGTGLGLSIAKQSVEAHDGTIIAESEKDAGTTFIVKFAYRRN